MYNTTRRNFVSAVASSSILALVPSKLKYVNPQELFQDTPTIEDPILKELANRALDAAVSYGANFADVRINVGRSAGLSMEDGKISAPSVGLKYTIGLRAAVDGAWGFASGSSVNMDGVAEVGRMAALFAKAGRTRKPRALELAPAEVISDGYWETPIGQDPFLITMGEQQELLLESYSYFKSKFAKKNRFKLSASGQLSWLRSDRIFASTEGSLIRQKVYHAYPGVNVSVVPIDDYTRKISIRAEDIKVGGYGYECLAHSNLGEALYTTAERGIGYVQEPLRNATVGRYDIVFSAQAMQSMMLQTIGRAIELERALGQKANQGGTTYAMPPLDIVGRYQLGSNLLNITADRSRPHAGCTVGWDEEGTKPDDFSLVRDGVVVDYISTRTTAPALALWYKSKNLPLKSHGCAVRSGSFEPVLQVPNLTLHSGKEDIGEEDLIKGIKRGMYVPFLFPSTDQQFLNAQGNAFRAHEIVNGKLGNIVKDAAIQFNTPSFWKALSVLGGPASVSVREQFVDNDIPGHSPSITLAAVPAMVRNVNIANVGKQV